MRESLWLAQLQCSVLISLSLALNDFRVILIDILLDNLFKMIELILSEGKSFGIVCAYQLNWLFNYANKSFWNNAECN